MINTATLFGNITVADPPVRAARKGLGWHRTLHDFSTQVKAPLLPRLHSNVVSLASRANTTFGDAVTASSSFGKSTASKARRKLLTKFPVPAEIKWHESLKIQAMVIQGNLEEMEWRIGATNAMAVQESSMYLTGKRWVREQTSTLSANRAGMDTLSEVLTVAFKSLDISSRVEVTDEGVAVTNTACPLLEYARKHKFDGAKICKIFCGEEQSFFKGVSYSYPLITNYRATQMMGKGDVRCKKTFNVRERQLALGI